MSAPIDLNAAAVNPLEQAQVSFGEHLRAAAHELAGIVAANGGKSPVGVSVKVPVRFGANEGDYDYDMVVTFEEKAT